MVIKYSLVAQKHPLISAMKEFGFIPNHVSPNFVQSELDAMVDVYDVMAKKWNLEVCWKRVMWKNCRFFYFYSKMCM